MQSAASRIVNNKNEEVPASMSECQFQDLVMGLRIGQWRVTQTWAGSCLVTLHSGSNVVTIKEGECTSL